MSERSPTPFPAPEQGSAVPLLPPRASRRLPPWMPLLVVALAWAAQGGALRNGWVWDDAILIRDGTEVARGFPAVPGFLAAPWGGEEHAVGLFRPLVSVTLAVQAGLHGVTDPFPFHLANLFLHGAAAVLLLAVLARLLPGRPVLASGAALLFAVHPAHAGTVSWIVARGDLLAAVFGLLAVLAWTRPGAPAVTSVSWTALAFFAALLSKEAAAMLLPALVVLDAARDPEGIRGALRRRGLRWVALVVPLVAWWVLRSAAVGGLDATVPNAALAGRGLFERIVVGCGALVRTAANLLVPAGLCGDGSGDPVLVRGTPLPPAYFAAAALVAALTALVAVRFLRGKRSPLDGAWGLFVLLSVPVLQIVPIGAVFEDRFAYLPSLAFLLVPAWLAEGLFERLPRRVPAAVPAAVSAAVIAAFCAGSWAVAADWHDEVAFDEALLRDDPKHLRALVRLGRERRIEGIALRERAQGTPSTFESRPEIEELLRESRGRLEDAVRLLERARSLPQGRRVSVLRGLGNAYLALDDPRPEAAEETFAALLEVLRVHVDGKSLSPAEAAARGQRSRARAGERALLTEIYSQRARAAIAMGDDEAAARWTGQAADWSPPDRALLRAAGMAWRKIGRPREAVPYLERAAAVAGPADRAVADREAQDAAEAAAKVDSDRFLEGKRAFDTHEMRKARLAFEEVVRERPDFVEARVMLAMSAHGQGDLRTAIDTLTAAKEILAKRTPGSTGEDDASLGKLVEKLLADYGSEWGK